jgi:hypothetical protein
MSMSLPIAHAGHWALWLVYAVPFVVVVFAIGRSVIEQRREARKEVTGDEEDGEG